jgi:aspartyl-tRNA(Asn)/glutamyl-tRNA(Gln) amidotransferase subunit B
VIVETATGRWEPVIGIEVHVELQTDSKMFCGCAVDTDAPPNTNVCPVCLALPGALPVTNRRAIEWITAIGLALDCSITDHTVFSRKNYFYADIPKGYQISQFDLPVCVDGHLDVQVDGSDRRIGIERAHMEEDTAKSVHAGEGGRIHTATASSIDFNRAGVPLVEIVSRPDIRSGAEARAYAQALRQVVLALGVSDAKLEEGSMRFDANVSVRPEGQDALGTKVEIKNMNSFRSLERAIDFEIERQIAAIEVGGGIVQETRHWDEADGRTHGMRTKEGSSDYRYFTEPDLPPMHLDEGWVAPIREALPELPAARSGRYVALGLDSAAAGVLAAAGPHTRSLLEEAIGKGVDARRVGLWLTQDVAAWLNREGRELADTALAADHLVELAGLADEGALSSSGVTTVLGHVLAGAGSPRAVAEAHDLIQISDAGALEAAVDAAIADHPDEWQRFIDGEQKLTGFFVGQVMRATGGKADPKVVARLLADKS